jgi:hypothetical protein
VARLPDRSWPRVADARELLDELIGLPEAPLAPALRRDRGARCVVVPVLSPPVPASPAVVEALVDLLVDAGADDVRVAGALTIADRDQGHSDVQALAVLAGYHGRTSRGRAYDVRDLHDELVPIGAPESGVLHAHRVSALWQRADLRVLVCRSATDAVDGLVGALDALLLVAPELPGAEAADVAAELLAVVPPHLCVADALVSSDGADGRRVLRELPTGTLAAATDAVRLDLVLGTLQGLDPGRSRLVQRALRSHTPASGPVLGDLTPFEGWVAAPPNLAEGVRRAADSAPAAVRVLTAAARDDGKGAPDAVLAALRTVLAPLVATADEPVSATTLTALLGTVTEAARQTEAWSTVFAKDRVPRLVVPLGFDPDDWPAEAYDALPQELAVLDDVLATLPTALPNPDGEGLRWCTLDGATIFETARVIEAPFDAFVARVDVAEGISLMADYLGGRRAALSWDGQGRPVRQAERNVYLPQPTYLALWGGPRIDVCKIELVERGDDRHALHWRTVGSPNGSASADDGTLTFAAVGPDRTRVSVRGRQRFTLPPFWQAVDLERWPELRAPLVEDAYRRFFTITFDNLEACYEGRPFRIGRPPEPAGPLPTRALQLLVDLAQDWLKERSVRTPRREPTAAPEVDLHGFRHFKGPGR